MKSNVKKLYRTHRIIFSLGMATALALTAGIAVVSASCSPTPNPDPEPPAPANHKLVMYASSNKLEYDSYNTASTIYATYTDSDQTPSTFTASQNISLKVKNSLVNDKYYIFRDNGDGSGVLTMREGIPSVGSVKHVDIEAEDADGLVSDYIVDLMPNRKNPSPIPTPQISISNDNPTLQYDNEDDRESKVDVSVNTGGVVTLTTSGDGENDY
ncbi:hypothetical protein FACS1894218_0600 [Bacilli bacterium]|nr:hypothetical protein FACS1894218_0600 [Bacilli bacterium]